MPLSHALHNLPIHLRVELYKCVLLHLIQRNLSSKTALDLVEQLFRCEVEGTILDEFAIPILPPRPFERSVVHSLGLSILLHFPHEAVHPNSCDKRVGFALVENFQSTAEVLRSDKGRGGLYQAKDVVIWMSLGEVNQGQLCAGSI